MNCPHPRGFAWFCEAKPGKTQPARHLSAKEEEEEEEEDAYFFVSEAPNTPQKNGVFNLAMAQRRGRRFFFWPWS